MEFGKMATQILLTPIPQQAELDVVYPRDTSVRSPPVKPDSRVVKKSGRLPFTKPIRCHDYTLPTVTVNASGQCWVHIYAKGSHQAVLSVKVRTLRIYEAASDRAYQKKKNIAEEVFTEIEIHSTIEEEIFYPALKAETDQEGQDLAAEAIEEHHVVAALIEELKALDPKDERYDAKFKVLMENIEHHIEEEGEMIPEAEEVLGEQLDHLCRQMHERKDQLLTSH